MKSPYLTISFIFFIISIGVAVLLLLTISGCPSLPVEMDSADIESRPQLASGGVKQVLRKVYDVKESKLTFNPDYDHYHLYTRDEIEYWLADSRWIEEGLEYNYEHRSCAWKARVLYNYLYGHMPGLPAFLIEIYRPAITRKGHMYVGVLYRPYGRANVVCLLLDYRYPIDDPRAIQELDLKNTSIGEINMAPGGMIWK